jgi:hypothetical protein
MTGRFDFASAMGPPSIASWRQAGSGYRETIGRVSICSKWRRLLVSSVRSCRSAVEPIRRSRSPIDRCNFSQPSPFAAEDACDLLIDAQHAEGAHEVSQSSLSICWITRLVDAFVQLRERNHGHCDTFNRQFLEFRDNIGSSVEKMDDPIRINEEGHRLKTRNRALTFNQARGVDHFDEGPCIDVSLPTPGCTSKRLPVGLRLILGNGDGHFFAIAQYHGKRFE